MPRFLRLLCGVEFPAKLFHVAFLIAALKLSDAWSKTESGSCARLQGWAKDSLKMKKKIKKKKETTKQPKPESRLSKEDPRECPNLESQKWPPPLAQFSRTSCGNLGYLPHRY